MPTIRERMTNLLLGDQKRQLQELARTMLTAYEVGPFEPTWTPERLKETLKEFDSAVIQDMVNQLEWERLGTFGYDPGLREAERSRAVRESRRLWVYDVVTDWIIALWTNFGFGENIQVMPEDQAAEETWEEFWQAARNEAVLGADCLQGLSDNLLVDGDLFLAFFVSKQDGKATVRLVPSDEITEIAKDKEDRNTPLFYKRVYSAGTGASETIYYPDWRAVAPGWSKDSADTRDDILGKAEIDASARRADKENPQTDVVMMHVAIKRKQGDRGWPLITASAPWIREHRRFRENRAAVAAALAMWVQKIKAKAGSRGIDAIRARLQSSLAAAASTDVMERNPPAVAGSTFIESEGATLERMPLGSGARDAQDDGNSLLMMAGLGGGVFPHWLGAGEAFRLATATAMETPTLRQFQRYQTYWAAQFRKMVTIVLGAAEVYGGKTFQDKRAEVTSDRLLDVDLKGIATAVGDLFETTIEPYMEVGLIPEDTVRRLLSLVWRSAVQALGSEDPDGLAGEQAFGIEPEAGEGKADRRRKGAAGRPRMRPFPAPAEWLRRGDG